ncbi:YppG family protein [Bacillus thermotolerans]|nr:YppG family protein [Bacillus thermotolerans]
MDSWHYRYPSYRHFSHYPPRSYYGPQFPPSGYSPTSGDLWSHPLYDTHMPEGPYHMYPTASASPLPASQPNSGGSLLLQSFKNKDGSLDINKAMETAGMMVNTVSQISKVVKDMAGWMKA